jgi:hypothetical protein
VPTFEYAVGVNVSKINFIKNRKKLKNNFLAGEYHHRLPAAVFFRFIIQISGINSKCPASVFFGKDIISSFIR